MQRSINPYKDLIAFFEIIKVIRKFKPDIVHTHASKSGAIGRLAAIIMNVPVIVHILFTGMFFIRTLEN